MANWTARVCASKAQHVVIFAGTNGENKVFVAEWKRGMGQVTYDLPANLQGLTKVWVRFETPGEELQTEVCVKWNGQNKRHFSFDGGGEDHFVETSDHDNDCLC